MQVKHRIGILFTAVVATAVDYGCVARADIDSCHSGIWLTLDVPAASAITAAYSIAGSSADTRAADTD